MIKFQGAEDKTFVMKYNTVEYGTSGVTVSSIGDSLIENCEIYNNTDGIHIIGNSNSKIKSNTIKFNQKGISGGDASISDILIVRNIITDNNDIGIYLYASYDIYNITIIDNTISSNGGSGIYFYADAYGGITYIYNITIEDNTISSNGGSGIYLYADASSYPHIYDITVTGNAISSNDDYGIYLYAYSKTLYYKSGSLDIYNITVNDNIVSSNGDSGIYLIANDESNFPESSNIYNISFNNNTISSNDDYGIKLEVYAGYYTYIYDITVTDNAISSSNYDGIYLFAFYIHNLTVTDNTISSNDDYGIRLHAYRRIYNVSIAGNAVSLNGYSGISLDSPYSGYVYNVTVAGNTVSLNEDCGIEIYSINHYAAVEFDAIMHDNYVYSNNQGISISGGGSKTHITSCSIHTNTLGVLYDYRTTDNFASLNNIYQNKYGMNVTNGATVKAEQNYWGDPSGPYHVSMNPEGTGNPVNGNGVDLDFIPFLTSPVEIGSPVASFIYSPRNPVVGGEITFDASSSYDQNGEIVSYRWDFGDGNVTSTTEEIIHHSYTAAGNYNVNLTVTDNDGLTNSTKEIIKISEPLTLGKGIWIWKLSEAEGGDVDAIIERCENVGIVWVAIKCGDGGYFWSQCKLSTIEQFQNAGIKVFGWQYVYGDDPIGEASVANQILDLGVDGFIIDAEAEYEGKPDNAITYLEKIREEHSDSFIAYTPFPIIDYHTDFPYLEFGKYCDAVMPQDYWKEIGVTPEYMVEWMEEQWDKWHTIWEAGGYGDSIKPIIPLGQGWDVTGSEITSFCDLVCEHGYGGVSLWRYGTMTEENWEAYAGCFVPPAVVFDTGSGTYPSIMGNHTGTIKPKHTIIATKLYTYPCTGTGGHTEYARIGNKTWNATATWEGYIGDWHNITFDKTVVLLADEEYNYTICTGSYPQIHHKFELPTENGWINCTKFTDANGRIYNDWIPAIRLE